MDWQSYSAKYADDAADVVLECSDGKRLFAHVAIVPLQVCSTVMTALLDVAYKLYTYTPVHPSTVIVDGIPVNWPDHKDHLLALDYLDASHAILETFNWWLGFQQGPKFKIVNELVLNMHLCYFIHPCGDLCSIPKNLTLEVKEYQCEYSMEDPAAAADETLSVVLKRALEVLKDALSTYSTTNMTSVIEPLLTFIGKLGRLNCVNKKTTKMCRMQEFKSVLTQSDIRSVLSDDMLAKLPLAIQRKLMFRSICPYNKCSLSEFGET
jgi:hypothetical protein